MNQRVRLSAVIAHVVALSLLVGGCRYFDNPSANIRCEQVSPGPQISKSDQERRDQIDYFNSIIDLEIARSDKEAIEFAKFWLGQAQKIYHQAEDAKSPTANDELGHVSEAEAALAKVIDTAARHRHR